MGEMIREIKRIQPPFMEQAEWQHPSPYPDGHWTPYRAVQYVLHYSGSRYLGIRSKWQAVQYALGIRSYHMRAKGMRDVAYAAMAWKKMLRFRGFNQNGAHSNSNVHGRYTFPILLPVGVGETPPDWMLETVARQFIAEPPTEPIEGHRDLPDQDTWCPGPIVDALILGEFWLHLRRTSFQATVPVSRRARRWNRAVAFRLNALGYDVRPNSRRFNRRYERAVIKFESDRGLVPDGVVGPKVLRELMKVESE